MVKNIKNTSDGPPANKPKSGAITVQQINADRLTQVGSTGIHLTSELITTDCTINVSTMPTFSSSPAGQPVLVAQHGRRASRLRCAHRGRHLRARDPQVALLRASHHDAGVLAVPGELPVAELPPRRGHARAHDVRGGDAEREGARARRRLGGVPPAAGRVRALLPAGAGGVSAGRGGGWGAGRGGAERADGAGAVSESLLQQHGGGVVPRAGEATCLAGDVVVPAAE